MPLFSFRRLEIEPLPVAMTGVKLGERLLQIGVDDGVVAGQLAAKTGLSGSASHAVSTDAEAVKVNRGAKRAGVLVEVRVVPLDTLPFEGSAFDVIVVHSAGSQLAASKADERGAVLRECRRVLRTGGRLIAIEPGTAAGLTAVFRSTPAAQAAYDAAGGTTGVLRQAGFAPVRELGDREGLKFTEGLNPA